MDELPEDTIDEVEGVNVAHSHDAVSSEDGSLADHLRLVHQLDAQPGLSASTQEGLHDRLHGETRASDD